MKHQRVIVAAVRVLVILAISGCGGDGQEPTGLPGAPEQFLRERIAMSERTGEVRTFSGDSLWEYIDGDAELYHQYGFVEVATADYRFADAEFIIDVYLFENETGAYGLYSAVRPDNAQLLKVGIQGFRTESTVTAVKGKYLARLIAFDESEETGAMLSIVDDSLVAALPGTVQRPEAFERFPDSGRSRAGDRYYAASFLGQAFLTNVYEQSYVLGEDTVWLFFAGDSSGEKYLEWQAAPGSVQADTGLPFDDGTGLTTEGYAGVVVAGLRDSYLVGMRNYEPRHREFLAAWLETFGQSLSGASGVD